MDYFTRVIFTSVVELCLTVRSEAGEGGRLIRDISTYPRYLCTDVKENRNLTGVLTSCEHAMFFSISACLLMSGFYRWLDTSLKSRS